MRCAAEQIKLWERERDRLVVTEATSWEEFSSDEEFARIVAFAKERRVLLVVDAEKKILVTTPAGYEPIKQLFQQVRECRLF